MWLTRINLNMRSEYSRFVLRVTTSLKISIYWDISQTAFSRRNDHCLFAAQLNASQLWVFAIEVDKQRIEIYGWWEDESTRDSREERKDIENDARFRDRWTRNDLRHFALPVARRKTPRHPMHPSQLRASCISYKRGASNLYENVFLNRCRKTPIARMSTSTVIFKRDKKIGSWLWDTN